MSKKHVYTCSVLGPDHNIHTELTLQGHESCGDIGHVLELAPHVPGDVHVVSPTYVKTTIRNAAEAIGLLRVSLNLHTLGFDVNLCAELTDALTTVYDNEKFAEFEEGK